MTVVKIIIPFRASAVEAMMLRIARQTVIVLCNIFLRFLLALILH